MAPITGAPPRGALKEASPITWFKVDDGFWRNRKPNRISPRQRLGAVGMWVLAGSWSADQMTDGAIELDDLSSIFPGISERVLLANAAELVRVGLWDVQPDGGWRFHDWEDCNPTKVLIVARRESDAQRKRSQRRSSGGKFLAPVPDGRAAGG